MELYLVQHGEAKPESEDPKRSLTDKGKADVELVAKSISRLSVKPSRILHSNKLRAKQTAEIFMQHLMPSNGISEQEGLAPKDDPEIVKQPILQSEEPLMIVGHLPHLSRLASSLILNDPDKEIISFSMAGVFCLIEKDGNWSLSWAILPELIR